MSFFNTINSLITDKSNSDSINSESAFTQICTDYLQESSYIPEFQIANYYKAENNNQHLKISGFCLNENEDSLSLFITDYNTSASVGNLNLNDVQGLFKQLYRVLNYVIRVKSDNIPKAHILSELHHSFISKIRDQLIQVNFYLLTNNKAVNRTEVKSDSILGKSEKSSNVDFNFRIIDLTELERLYKNNQVLDIDVASFYDKPITILKPNIKGLSYGSAISIFPGEFLFNIYKEFGARLLESNVRSFLTANVSVNKGIAKTLVENPDMFLAYNNGLCVTVSEIELNADGTVKLFKNFQIVNGGQTTSSIYFSKKKNAGIRLDFVNVMVKITELKRNIDSLIIQKKIAINSNLQNAVKTSDLSSNEEFLKNLHSCSKKFRNPLTNKYFYFERTRGQYKLERDLGKNAAQFETIYPLQNVIDKSILSILFFCSNRKETAPYLSVQSSEKRYKILKSNMAEENKYLSEKYFVRLVGSFILYNYLLKIYGSGNNAIGSIRKNVIAYSFSLIQFKLLKDGNSINFEDIWIRNILADSSLEIKKYLIYVNKLLLENFNDGRLDEACKKEESWKLILSKADKSEIENIIKYLPICQFVNDTQNANETESAISNKHELMVEEINKMINSIDRYKRLIGRVQEEIETHFEVGDGMSLYNRSHETLLKEHFRADAKKTIIKPKSYSIYLLECQKADGSLIKIKVDVMKNYVEELYRVYEAVLKDELLTF